MVHSMSRTRDDESALTLSVSLSLSVRLREVIGSRLNGSFIIN